MLIWIDSSLLGIKKRLFLGNLFLLDLINSVLIMKFALEMKFLSCYILIHYLYITKRIVQS